MGITIKYLIKNDNFFPLKNFFQDMLFFQSMLLFTSSLHTSAANFNLSLELL